MSVAYQNLGEFRILRELGRGGMGVVYEALQTSLGRRVALKVLGPGIGLTPRAVDRFRREAIAAAKLHHTNIVPVYATGEADGVYFYAMELIEGPSLDHVIRQMRASGADDARTETPADHAATGPYLATESHRTPSTTGSSASTGSSVERFDCAAAMIADVAEALHHAHQNGVTHRDVKPSNLLLSAEGRLSVTDFGLARMLEQPGMTVTGEFVGTPAYMSPEQITAGRIPVDHRTDVYSLGASLYELLTLRPPFSAEGRDRLLALVIQKEPPTPRSIDARIPRDLETICLKCLEKDPDRRYQTARELAEDLRRFVNRFAIQAKRAGPLSRLKKWVRRNPVLTALLACLLIATMMTGGFAYQARQDRARLRMEQSKAATEKAILDAMSGDSQAALQAIAEAEETGAAPGQLNMLRGLVELNRGRPREALVHLELAEKQWPDSAGVKALLARAYLSNYQYQRYFDLLVLAEQLGPTATEDYIFLGEAQAHLDARKGLATLDAAPARARQSSVARLARAVIQTWYAYETGQAEDFDKALHSLDRVDLPDNPLLMKMEVHAFLGAAHKAGSNSAADAYRKQAGTVANRLARFPDLPSAIRARCLYYYVIGDDDTLLDVVRQGKQHLEDRAFDYEYDILYRRKRYEEALTSLQTSRWGDAKLNKIWQGTILATLGRTAEAERLLLDCRDDTGEVDSIFGYLYLGHLYLLGPGAQIDPAQEARNFLAQSHNALPPWRNGWYRDLLKYNAGVIDSNGLLEKAGDSRTNQCEACFFIGLHKLHERKRSEAKEWLTRSVATGVYAYTEYMWSRAFLASIDDPNWMPWLEKR